MAALIKSAQEPLTTYSVWRLNRVQASSFLATSSRPKTVRAESFPGLTDLRRHSMCHRRNRIVGGEEVFPESFRVLEGEVQAIGCTMSW